MLNLLLALALAAPQSPGPVEFGRQALERACEAAQLQAKLGDIEVRVDATGIAESFTLSTDGSRARIVASDASGAMYGELELAERIERLGAKAFEPAESKHEPFLSVRAINPFLTLPWDSERNEPVYDSAALNDPQRWWFHDEDYWTTLFDLMAEARLNQLDLHGTYDIDTTRFPNLYAYFIDSPSFPDVGVAPAIKAKNLAQLAHVIEMAHARGIKLSVMSYEAQFYTPHHPKPPYESSEANLYKYTREVVEAMIRALPVLDAIGFRIGESGHGAEFFKCYTEAAQASGRDIPLYTRSWITRKQVVVPLAQASSDFSVEIKFNGEQWGPPYPIAGGRVPGWHSYSFEDYLSDSNVKSAAKMWPGVVADNGERWPAQPYKIVWQVRANGTHRIFPFYEPDWVRRTLLSMPMGTARGFSVEMMNSYFPATPRYYLAEPGAQWCDWIHERDALWLVQWGRLGYDPRTPESVFEAAIGKHIGLEAQDYARTWKQASRVVPSNFTAWSLGPDHRDHAPELEWGGTLDDFIQGEAFDSHALLSIKEQLAFEATGGHDGRMRPTQVDQPIDFPFRIDDVTLSGSELAGICGSLRSLSLFFSNKAHAAECLARAEAGERGRAWGLEARGYFGESASEWVKLATTGIGLQYKPFTDRLRMRSNRFHWQDELPKVQTEVQRLEKLFPGEPIRPKERPSEIVRPKPRLEVRSDAQGRVHCRIEELAGLERAWLLWKPLPSSTFFHSMAMAREGKAFVASLDRLPAGQAISAELEVGNSYSRIPDWRVEQPYLVVPASSGPTPQYYSSQEALRYLRPASLDPAKHGMMLIAARAWDFHRGFDVATQRKLLDGVKRGMKLLVLQQDYTSGRYPLDWFPKRPTIVNGATTVFDPAGALGLEKVETQDVLYQPIQASEDWEVFGNGGLARCKYGEGEIWLCQARLMQRMHIPGCSRNLKRLLELGGRENPVVVVDPGSEGNRYASSVFCDFMNAHEISFLTLGEVIVNEQGMDSFEVVRGSLSPDRILEGRGSRMVADWLAKKIRESCDQAAPASVSSFKTARETRVREFLRSIGLDPLPPRTPLNTRVTGRLDREGYTLEKIVYESRPNFPVTAHLYVPKGHDGEQLPVIVNATGHWPHKKSEPTEQARLISQARAGYLAIEVDSPGHSYEGGSRIERRGAGTHFDPRLIAGSTTADTVYVWDLMRAVDYLATRPEADMSRVGITGVSGGGHATMFAFAADERFACAVPVCYPTSFLDGWDNGCDCNHVPGYMQVGDRADVIALRAPAPVFVIGAKDDREFPASGTLRTGEKLKTTWKLFGAEDKAWCRVFEGGHDYSKPMREAAMGFFDLHLRQKGDGSPVAEATITTEPPESEELLCLPDPPLIQLTMREIARANVERAGDATWDAVVALNGGWPARVPLEFKTLPGLPDEPGQPVTFQSEPGITIPALLYRPATTRAAIVFVHEGGKLAARREFPIDALVADGFACLLLDVRGFGELPGLDPKLMSYLGIADSFAMGWDAARAAEVLLDITPRVAVVGKGACGSLVALYSGLMEPRVSLVVGLEALEQWSELFDDDVPTIALQPRVMYGATIGRLRSLLARPVEWQPRKSLAPDLRALLARQLL